MLLSLNDSQYFRIFFYFLAYFSTGLHQNFHQFQVKVLCLSIRGSLWHTSQFYFQDDGEKMQKVSEMSRNVTDEEKAAISHHGLFKVVIRFCFKCSFYLKCTLWCLIDITPSANLFFKIFPARTFYSNLPPPPPPRLLNFGRISFQHKVSRYILILYRWK